MREGTEPTKATGTTRIPKGDVLGSWKPYQVIPFTGSSNEEEEKYEDLPGYHPCLVWKLATRNKATTSGKFESKSLSRFVAKLRQDGSFDALCMLSLLELVISNGDMDWTTILDPSNNNENQGGATVGDDEYDSSFLVEGWPMAQEQITWKCCQVLYEFLRVRVHMVTVPHTLSEYATKTLLNIPKVDFDRAIQIAHSHNWIPKLTTNRLQASQFFLDYIASLPPRILGVLTEDPTNLKPQNNESLQQSCLPNASLELSTEDSTNSIVCSCVAIYDLESYKEASVSTRPASSICECLKCRRDETPFTVDEKSLVMARRLAHDYFQQGSYDSATEVYQKCHDAMLLAKDVNAAADFLHSMAAVDLTRLEFLQAQKRWKEGSRYEKSHSGIKLQLEKQRAYRYFEPLPEQRTSSALTYRSLGTSGRLFVTENITSKDVCRQLIEWAEEQASLGGWTTARHYAVPTTDIPVHKAPRLLEWFNKWMEEDMIALLRTQFQTKQRFYVHDAFLVRYDACSSSHFLPLHFDESTHSFVLALNDDFEGGGTYFYALDETLSPKTGTIVTFRGNQLLHGGNCVTKGVRYILAGFLYADGDSTMPENDRHQAPSAASQVFEAKRQKTAKESFSFTFF